MYYCRYQHLSRCVPLVSPVIGQKSFMKVLFVVAHIDKITIKPHIHELLSQIFVPATRLHVVLVHVVYQALTITQEIQGYFSSIGLAEIIFIKPYK